MSTALSAVSKAEHERSGNCFLTVSPSILSQRPVKTAKRRSFSPRFRYIFLWTTYVTVAGTTYFLTYTIDVQELKSVMVILLVPFFSIFRTIEIV